MLIEDYFQQIQILIETSQIVQSFNIVHTEHHRKLNLPTFPHHKHDGSEDNVVKSNAPFLADVLQEIEKILG